MEGAVSSQSLEHTLICLVRKEEREERRRGRGIHLTPSSLTIYHLDDLSFSELPFPQLNMEVTVRELF